MKVAIYCRVSTEEQEQKNQLKGCESINDYGVYQLFEDKQSAWKDNKEREGFNKLKNQIKKKQIDHLIVWDLDRIYRNRKRLIEFFRFCGIYNCKIHSYRQSWLDNLNNIPEPFNEIVYDMMLQLMGWMAEDESNKKSERVKQAVRRKKKGTYSYKGNKWGRRAIPKQTKDRIIELYNKGTSMRKIKENAYWYDKNKNKKSIGLGTVHKIIEEYRKEKGGNL
jgi:DNA invertase Pin-like site-specific DNA recombinase|tara:strand:- start:4127 stop:4792 length:666 start_codon:yes stop_codon:yes gene_type:complete